VKPWVQTLVLPEKDETIIKYEIKLPLKKQLIYKNTVALWILLTVGRAEYILKSGKEKQHTETHEEHRTPMGLLDL
jgi:hypothetical protein